MGVPQRAAAAPVVEAWRGLHGDPAAAALLLWLSGLDPSAPPQAGGALDGWPPAADPDAAAVVAWLVALPNPSSTLARGLRDLAPPRLRWGGVPAERERALVLLRAMGLAPPPPRLAPALQRVAEWTAFCAAFLDAAGSAPRLAIDSAHLRGAARALPPAEAAARLLRATRRWVSSGRLAYGERLGVEALRSLDDEVAARGALLPLALWPRGGAVAHAAQAALARPDEPSWVRAALLDPTPPEEAGSPTPTAPGGTTLSWHGALLERAMVEGVPWSPGQIAALLEVPSRIDATLWIEGGASRGPRRLLWARAGRLTQVRSGEPVAPAELRGAIRLVHPVELPPARLAALQARLGTQAQPFEQLGRQVLRVSPAERGSRWSSALAAEVVDDRVLHSDLARRGWRRGEIMDTGVFYELYTGALPGGWWAFISLDPGIAGNGPEGVAQRIVGVHFVRAREDRPGAIPFDFHAFWRREVAAGRRDRHRSVEAVLGVTLRSVPAVVFSEIMRVVGAAAGRARRALLTAPRDSTQP